MYCALEVITELLRLRTGDAKARNKLKDRLAKAESDVSLLTSKIERMQDTLIDKEKKIGELENTIYTTNSAAKKMVTKTKAEVVEKQKIKANKDTSSNLYEHELKKKDLEISKLKDTLKKSSLLHRDRIDSVTKYSRFELNNFYDGIEKDFNILDSKKTEIYKNMIDECNEMRIFIMDVYSDLLKTIKTAASTIKRHMNINIPNTLNTTSLNKPFAYCKDDIKSSFSTLYNDITYIISS